jgi:hypothetical protein
MLQPIVDILYPSLCHLFNFSLQCSTFPLEWKKAVIIPLEKCHNPNNLTDYRPISILSVLAKMLEKNLYDQVLQFINVNNILDELQSGVFVKIILRILPCYV